MKKRIIDLREEAGETASSISFLMVGGKAFDLAQKELIALRSGGFPKSWSRCQEALEL